MKRHTFFRDLVRGLAILTLTAFAGPLFAQGDTGYLRTRVTPGVAGVFIDGEYQGTVAQFKSSKNVIAVSPGEHRIQIVDPRYEPYNETITFEAGKTHVVRQALKPKAAPKPPFGKLKIKGGNRAAVYINNQYYGQSDEFNGAGQALLMVPGEYQLRVVPKNGSPLEQKITITANQTTKITL